MLFSLGGRFYRFIQYGKHPEKRKVWKQSFKLFSEKKILDFFRSGIEKFPFYQAADKIKHLVSVYRSYQRISKILE